VELSILLIVGICLIGIFIYTKALSSNPRKIYKRLGERIFQNIIPSLEGMDDEEIGFLLDQMIEMKRASWKANPIETTTLLFEDPIMVPEDIAYKAMDLWFNEILNLQRDGNIYAMAKIGTLSVCFLSLVSMHIVEHRKLGKQMWQELSRGFPYASLFDPKKDCVKGLEPS
jgi:hypothetical protein